MKAIRGAMSPFLVSGLSCRGIGGGCHAGQGTEAFAVNLSQCFVLLQ